MTEGTREDLSMLLERIGRGDKAAEDEFISEVYEALRRIAAGHVRRERKGHTLQTTALVNEAYLKLFADRNMSWSDRTHFFSVAATVMRQILIDYARSHRAEKRGGGAVPLQLDEGLTFSPAQCDELAHLDEALQRLEQRDARAGRVVELRFFGGLSVEETAAAMAISPRTVKREWNFGRAWLRTELGVPNRDEA